MRSLLLKSSLVLAVALSLSIAPAAERASTTSGTGPTFKSIGPLTFAPDGLLFAGDTQSASIFALELGVAGPGRCARRQGDRGRRSADCGAPRHGRP